ncbi:MAG: hypothetical protein KDJ45_03475, partial [Hyphomicrobiaceae bacterium]|nr:hypothetical protein [Hyphomicrobiaceae bacterium]
AVFHNKCEQVEIVEILHEAHPRQSIVLYLERIVWIYGASGNTVLYLDFLQQRRPQAARYGGKT